MFFPRQRNQVTTPTIKINDISIERVSHFKSLGVIFDENLSWKHHTDSLAIKLSKYAGILNRLKHYLPLYILKTLYHSFVSSNLNFGILTWGFMSNRLNKIQKRLVRTITVSKYNAHTDPLFKVTGILKISDLLDWNALKFYYKYIHHNLPNYFYSFQLATRVSLYPHHTRNSSQLLIPRTRTVMADKLLRNYLPKLVNSTPLSTLNKISTHSFSGFSNYAKIQLIQCYSTDCHLPNCYICQN